MESVWRRYCDFTTESKRSKLGADCTCPYSPYGHVEGRTFCWLGRGVTWRLLVGCWLPNGMMTHVICSELKLDTWPNHWAPRVTILLANLVMCKSFGEPAGFDLGTSPHGQSLNTHALANCPSLVPCYKGGKYYIWICNVLYWNGGSGRGLAPTRGYMRPYIWPRHNTFGAFTLFKPYVILYCIITIHCNALYVLYVGTWVWTRDP